MTGAILDQQMRIDMSAIFDTDSEFVTVNFGSAAGYAANALKYFTQYASCSPKNRLQKAFGKAAAAKHLR